MKHISSKEIKLHPTTLCFTSNQSTLGIDQESHSTLHAFLDVMNLFKNNDHIPTNNLLKTFNSKLKLSNSNHKSLANILTRHSDV